MSRVSPKKSPAKRPATAVTRTVITRTSTNYIVDHHLTAIEVENESLRTKLYGLTEQSNVVADL